MQHIVGVGRERIYGTCSDCDGSGTAPRGVETPEAAVEAVARVLRYHIRDDTLQWYEHIARAVVDAIEAAGWTPPGGEDTK